VKAPPTAPGAAPRPTGESEEVSRRLANDKSFRRDAIAALILAVLGGFLGLLPGMIGLPLISLFPLTLIVLDLVTHPRRREGVLAFLYACSLFLFAIGAGISVGSVLPPLAALVIALAAYRRVKTAPRDPELDRARLHLAEAKAPPVAPE